MHVFSLISINMLCFYVAFVKPFVDATPKGHESVNEPCAPYGCQLELALQLAINMGGKPVTTAAFFLLFPHPFVAATLTPFPLLFLPLQ